MGFSWYREYYNRSSGWVCELNVRCPRCGGRALYDTPFIYLREKDPLPDTVHHPVHRYNNGLVLEKYPSVFPWRPRARCTSTNEPTGVVRCTDCYLVARHALSWPNDAYYKWEIRGRTLWAFNWEHARTLLDYLASKDREPSKYDKYGYYLRKLPREIIIARSREAAVRALSDTLLKGKRR